MIKALPTEVLVETLCFLTSIDRGRLASTSLAHFDLLVGLGVFAGTRRFCRPLGTTEPPLLHILRKVSTPAYRVSHVQLSLHVQKYLESTTIKNKRIIVQCLQLSGESDAARFISATLALFVTSKPQSLYRASIYSNLSWDLYLFSIVKQCLSRAKNLREIHLSSLPCLVYDDILLLPTSSRLFLGMLFRQLSHASGLRLTLHGHGGIGLRHAYSTETIQSMRNEVTDTLLDPEKAARVGMYNQKLFATSTVAVGLTLSATMPPLQHLHLHNYGFQEMESLGSDVLGLQSFLQSSALQSLTLTSVFFSNGSDLLLIARCIVSMPKLYDLRLRDVQSRTMVQRDLTWLLMSEGKHLRHLEISHIETIDDELPHPSTSLQRLYLKGMRICNEALFKMIPMHLQDLDLSQCSLDMTSFVPLGMWVGRNDCAIKSLVLQCNILTYMNVGYFTSGLQKNRSLRSLNFDDNFLGMRGLQMILSSLPPTMQMLHFRRNTVRIVMHDLSDLLSMVRVHCPRLQTIDLRNNLVLDKTPMLDYTRLFQTLLGVKVMV